MHMLLAACWFNVCGKQKQDITVCRSRFVQLTDRGKRMLDGEEGEAIRTAMSILMDIGNGIEAEEMVGFVQVHTDSGFCLGDAGLGIVEHYVKINKRRSLCRKK